MASETKTIPNIRIIGGGVAGLTLATRLGHVLGRGGLARISLIDSSQTHVWKPMLHTFAAGTRNVYQQQVQYLVHTASHHFEYIPGQMEQLDRDGRKIRLAAIHENGETIVDTRELPYDILVLATGSRANDFGTKGVTEQCHFIDSQHEANAFNSKLRTHVARSFLSGHDIRIAIVGGGATGVELAAELTRMVELAGGYGETDMRKRLHITLLENGPRLLAAFPEQVSSSTESQLRKLGCDVRTGVRVIAADENGFQLETGDRVDADLKVWAAGVRASDAIGDSDLELNHANQIVVTPSLLAKGDTSIFAVGDCSSFTPEGSSRPLPATAQVANQQALHLVKHLPGLITKGKQIAPFQFQDLGSLVSLSDYNAFGTLGRFGFFRGGFIKGRFAQASHAYLYRRHQVALHGPARAFLLWLAERINALVQPSIRMN